MQATMKGPELAKALGMEPAKAKEFVHRLSRDHDLLTNLDAWVQQTKAAECSVEEALEDPDAVTRKREAKDKLARAQREVDEAEKASK
jgi:DNA-directed RNA polymerase specialized sigma subunit